jgi:hypothetical protein
MSAPKDDLEVVRTIVDTIKDLKPDVNLPPGLRQTVKTQFAVR